MKVLNVVGVIDAVKGGGTGERIYRLSLCLAKEGIDCSILSLNTGLTKERLQGLSEVKVYALKCLWERFCIPLVSFKKLRNIVKQSDVVHLMGHWTLLNAMVYRLARKYHKPYVICPAGSLPIYGRSRKLKSLYNWVVGKNIVRNADACIAITQNEISHYEQYGVDLTKICLIPNGVSIELYQRKANQNFYQQHHIPEVPFILFLGRLNPIKGPDILLEAFLGLSSHILDYHLVFAGPDQGMQKKLEAKIPADMRGRVHFIGYIGGEGKSAALYAADLLVIPSRSEAMSIVVLEAGATATPVLATDQCGINDIETIQGGKIVEVTVESVREGLERLLSNKDGLETMGINLKKWVEQHYSWDKIVMLHVNLFEKVLKERSFCAKGNEIKFR